MTTHTEKLIQDGLWQDISEAPAQVLLCKALKVALTFIDEIGDISGRFTYLNGTPIVSASREVKDEIERIAKGE